MGATYRGRKTGALGDIGVFSFHQQKNMATLGEGGMITTDDRQLYERMLSYRSLCCRTYDPKGKYLPIDESMQPMGKRYWLLDFDEVGYNFRMTDAQAAVGLVQLAKLDGFNRRRAGAGRSVSPPAGEDRRADDAARDSPDNDPRLSRVLRAGRSRVSH